MSVMAQDMQSSWGSDLALSSALAAQGQATAFNMQQGAAVRGLNPVAGGNATFSNCIIDNKISRTFREQLQAETDEWLKE